MPLPLGAYPLPSRLMQVMPDVPISIIREEFEHVATTFSIENAISKRGSGLGHPGHDCWTFPRSWVPRLFLGFTVVGVSMIATDLMQVLLPLPRPLQVLMPLPLGAYPLPSRPMQALHAISGCRMSLLSPRLTFHFVEGDSVVRHPGGYAPPFRCLCPSL